METSAHIPNINRFPSLSLAALHLLWWPSVGSTREPVSCAHTSSGCPLWMHVPCKRVLSSALPSSGSLLWHANHPGATFAQAALAPQAQRTQGQPQRSSRSSSSGPDRKSVIHPTLLALLILRSTQPSVWCVDLLDAPKRSVLSLLTPLAASAPCCVRTPLLLVHAPLPQQFRPTPRRR